MDSRAVEFMRDCGYDLTAHFPKQLGELPPEVFEVVVTMGDQGAEPVVRAKRSEEWNVPSPDILSPDEFRAMGVLIEEEVRHLLNGL